MPDWVPLESGTTSDFCLTSWYTNLKQKPPNRRQPPPAAPHGKGDVIRNDTEQTINGSEPPRTNRASDSSCLNQSQHEKTDQSPHRNATQQHQSWLLQLGRSPQPKCFTLLSWVWVQNGVIAIGELIGAMKNPERGQNSEWWRIIIQPLLTFTLIHFFKRLGECNVLILGMTLRAFTPKFKKPLNLAPFILRDWSEQR